jgi:hypothetical protein
MADVPSGPSWTPPPPLFELKKKDLYDILNRSELNYELRYKYRSITGSRDSAVGIATAYGLDRRGVGVRVPVGARFCSPPHRPHRLCGPPSPLSNGIQRDIFTGVKRSGREARHSPSTSAESRIIHSPIRLHCGVFNQLSAGTSPFLYMNYLSKIIHPYFLRISLYC